MQLFPLSLSASFYPTAIILLTSILSSAPWCLAQFTVKRCDAACHIQASLPPLCGLPCLQKLKVFFAISVIYLLGVAFISLLDGMYCISVIISTYSSFFTQSQKHKHQVDFCVFVCLCVLWGGLTLFCLSPSNCWHWLGGFENNCFQDASKFLRGWLWINALGSHNRFF